MFAGVPSNPVSVSRWLDDLGLRESARVPIANVDPIVRLRLLTELAILREGVEGLVLVSPDRHGGDPQEWWTLARGLAELARFGEAEGARRETLMGLSGLGDLVLSAGSLTSRNMAFGHAIGRGADLAALRRQALPRPDTRPATGPSTRATAEAEPPPPPPPLPGPKLATVEPIWVKTWVTSGCLRNRASRRWAVSSMSAAVAPGGAWMLTYM